VTNLEGRQGNGQELKAALMEETSNVSVELLESELNLEELMRQKELLQKRLGMIDTSSNPDKNVNGHSQNASNSKHREEKPLSTDSRAKQSGPVKVSDRKPHDEKRSNKSKLNSSGESHELEPLRKKTRDRSRSRENEPKQSSRRPFEDFRRGGNNDRETGKGRMEDNNFKQQQYREDFNRRDNNTRVQRSPRRDRDNFRGSNKFGNDRRMPDLRDRNRRNEVDGRDRYRDDRDRDRGRRDAPRGQRGSSPNQRKDRRRSGDDQSHQRKRKEESEDE
jgi:hypothetical protein